MKSVAGTTQLVVTELVRMLDQQARVADAMSAQATTLAALPSLRDGALLLPNAAPAAAPAAEQPGLDPEVLEAAEQLTCAHRDMSVWLTRVADEAKAQRVDLECRREALLKQARRVFSAQSELASLAVELQVEHAAAGSARGESTQRTGPSSANAPASAAEVSAASAGAPGAAWCWSAGNGGGGDGDGGDGGAKGGGGDRTIAGGSAGGEPSTAAAAADIVRLNVGGSIFCTTRATLCAEESMLSTMFSGRYPTGGGGGDEGVFIDRDGTHFRHILNYLRGGELHLGRDLVTHRALLQEADFYMLSGLKEQLLASLSRYEDKGERLRRLSMDSTIERTQGTFDDLISQIYEEVEAQAARGKRICSIGFLQEKHAKGLVYRSQVSFRTLTNSRPGHLAPTSPHAPLCDPQSSSFWDKSIHDARLHRLLSSLSNQQVLCNRLADEGLKAHIKPISVNAPAGDDHWVSTTTLLLTVTIWEPTHLLDAQHSVDGAGASAPGSRRGSMNGTPTQLRSSSTGDDVGFPADGSSCPTVHRRTISTGWE